MWLQVVRNACGLAVLEDYHQLGKYNIKTVCAADDSPVAAADSKPAGEEKPAGNKPAEDKHAEDKPAEDKPA